MTKVNIVIFLLSLISLNGSYLSDANIKLAQNNIDEAIKLYKLSAREGEDEANFQLGKIYYQKQDLNKSFEYFKKASDYGHQKAKFNLGVIFSQKKFDKFSYKSSYKLFYDLATQNYTSAQYKVGIYLLYGIGVPKDYAMAKAWLERAYFKNDHEKAACGLATIYANGFGVIQNLGRARKLSEDKINKYPLCKKVFQEFTLYKSKYKEDKGFKSGYYK